MVLSAANRVVAPGHVCGIIFRADEDEIIPCDLTPVDAKAFANEFFLGLRVVHEHQVRIASPYRFESLTRALGYHANFNSG